MKISYQKMLLAALFGFCAVNICSAAQSTGTIITMSVSSNSPDGIDRATAIIRLSDSSTFDVACNLPFTSNLIGLHTKNLTDPGSKAQFNILLSAKISALPVTIIYGGSGQSCAIDNVLM